jgi:crossover junction endodeoxyribonuclease RusA
MEILVAGVPIPQGSMRHIGNGVIISSNPKLKKWREQIAKAVVAIYGEPAIDQPVAVSVVFNMPRLPSVKRDHPTVAPDLDKLQRAIGDALSIDCKYLKDDAVIVEWHAYKRYDPNPSAVIQVQILK